MLYKRFIPLLLLFLATLCVSFCAAGYGLSVKDVVNPRISDQGWVSDQASVLEQKTEERLNRQIKTFEAQTSGEMAIVTIPNVDSEITVRQFAISLFNHWGVGKADTDNGVLLLLAMDDRRVELVTGRGIDQILTDEIAADIIQTKILPALRRDNPDRAVLLGTKAVLTTLRTTQGVSFMPWPKAIIMPGLLSRLLLCRLGVHLWKLRQLKKTDPILFDHFQQALEEGSHSNWQRGELAVLRQQDESQVHFLTQLAKWRRRSFFLGMLALTNLLLALVGYYWPVGSAIAISLCFPITFGLKNIRRFSRQKVLAGTLMQAVVAVMTIGIFGTLFLQNVEQVHWLVTLPLAASISFFNTINWHRYLNIQYGSSSSSTTRGGYSGYGSGLSTGGGSSSDSGGSSFGGGSSEGGGAGGSW